MSEAASLTLTIDRLGQEGDGLSTGPQGTLAVPGALPGEVVEVVPEGAVLSQMRVLTPSAARVRPSCPHARACGGCRVQHAADDLVAAWKRDLVMTALAARGIAAEVGSTDTSPPASRRRAGFAGRRTKKGAIVGFHGRASHTLVEAPECQVVTPALRAAMPLAAEMTVLGGSRKGELSFLVTDTLGGVDMAVRGGRPLDLPLRARLAEMGGAAGLARLTWDNEPVAVWATPEVAMGRARVALPPGAFLQATAHGQDTLSKAVCAAVGDAARVADLFCGCGTFTLPLAERAEVLAVEAEAAATAALDAAWRRTGGLKRVTTQARDLFRRPLLPEELTGLDAVVLDPPRAGAAAQTAELARSDVRRIAMVSCNPATFARDAAALIAGGYRMGRVAVIDQFRWSPHVEMAAPFHRP